MVALTSTGLVIKNSSATPDVLDKQADQRRHNSGTLTNDNGVEFELNSQCPRGFKLIAENQCELRTNSLFDSSADRRSGASTHTSRPQHRDGFSPQQIDLGRFLFFDPALSGDGNVSCASCHRPDKGFADGRARSIGANAQLGERSTPSLWNSAFSLSFFWDARATSLEAQVTEPLFNRNEMNNTKEKLLATLRANQTYQGLFLTAFGIDSKVGDSITLPNVYNALTAFQTSLISLNSRYDAYVRGNHDILNEDEIAGMTLFMSPTTRCSQCHTPPLFTNGKIAVIGVPEPAGRTFDVGAENVFGLRKLRGGFKIPSLRNIEKTAPYMHQGNFKDLRSATEFYNKGRGHAVASDETLYLHWLISEPNLSTLDIELLVKFMKTLTDESLVPQTPEALPSGLPLPALPSFPDSAR